MVTVSNNKKQMKSCIKLFHFKKQVSDSFTLDTNKEKKFKKHMSQQISDVTQKNIMKEL
jgi:hypothetical protein